MSGVLASGTGASYRVIRRHNTKPTPIEIRVDWNGLRLIGDAKLSRAKSGASIASRLTASARAGDVCAQRNIVVAEIGYGGRATSSLSSKYSRVHWVLLDGFSGAPFSYFG
jgi:hypothetical protein